MIESYTGLTPLQAQVERDLHDAWTRYDMRLVRNAEARAYAAFGAETSTRRAVVDYFRRLYMDRRDPYLRDLVVMSAVPDAAPIARRTPGFRLVGKLRDIARLNSLPNPYSEPQDLAQSVIVAYGWRGAVPGICCLPACDGTMLVSAAEDRGECPSCLGLSVASALTLADLIMAEREADQR